MTQFTSNQTRKLSLRHGVILLLGKEAFKGKNDCLIEAINKENITLRGAQTVLKMQQEDYAKDAIWKIRMATLCIFMWL